MRALLVLVVVASACAREGEGARDSGVDARVGLDATVEDAGSDATNDAAVDAFFDDGGLEQRVPCGGVMCDTRQVCCTTDDGVTGECRDISPGCSPGQQRLICDDARDCVASAECCYAMRVTSCLPDGTCDAVGGQLACRSEAECASGSCCPISPGSPYSTCRTAPCP